MSGEIRERLRSNQACINCRRKKARCPGERPACSTCIRLKQRCSYTTRALQETRTLDRLAFLEKKLDLVLNERVSNSLPGSSTQLDSISTEHREPPQERPQDRMHDLPETSHRADIPLSPGDQPNVIEGSTSLGPCSGFDVPSLQISPSALREGIRLYFKFCHRQPLWCFERQDLDDACDLPEELVSSIVELTSRFSPDHASAQTYGNHARWSIMHRVASSTVGIGTMESLCLLSYSAFMDGDSQLGQFYLGLGFQICYSTILDPATTSTYATPDIDDRPATEREKKVFWSLQSLAHFYSHQHGILGIPYNTLRPFFDYSARSDPQLHAHRVLNLPPLPRDDAQAPEPSDEGIWSFEAHFGWIWSRARAYIFEYAHGRIRTPWRQESTYTAILADLTEVENKVSACHRYSCVKFHQRSPHELAQNRNYWVPWLRLQFDHHSILTVLNHPFLYIMSSQHNPTLELSNTFWRRSAELVLLHATWIVRMIDLVSEKRMQLIDPFFAHAAAIAATVHLYFCCAADPRLKRKSMADFTRCRGFIETFVSFSPACDALAQSLDQITLIASGSKHLDPSWSPSKIHLSIPHMWSVLQANANSNTNNKIQHSPSHPAHPTTSLSTNSNPNQNLNPNTTNLNPTTTTNTNPTTTAGATSTTTVNSTIEIKIAISPEITVNTNTAADDPHNAGLPPFHVSGPSASSPPPPSGENRSGTSAGTGAGSPVPDVVVAAGDALMSNTPWLWTSASPALGLGGTGGEEVAGVWDSMAMDFLGSGWWEGGSF